MHNRWISLVTLGVVCGLSPAVNAASEPLSYSAGGSCYCNVPALNSVGKQRVATPIGGQSVSQVCERIGKGPELTFDTGYYNYPVYDDAQCGHGPGMPGFKGLLSDSDSAITKGPKWDLANVYAQSGENTSAGKSITQTPVAENASGETDSKTRTKTRFQSRYVQSPASTKQSEPAEATASAERTDAIRTVPIVKKPDPEPSQQAASSSMAEPAVAAASPTPAKPKITKEVNKPQFEEKIIETRPIVKADKPNAPIVVVNPEIAAALEESKEVVEAITPNPEAGVTKVPASNALNLAPSARASARDFDYFSVLPISFDFGGAGLQVAGSYAPANKVRLVARAGVADSYQEALLGASYLITPQNARRISFSFTGGVEFGRLSIEGQGIETSASETGFFGRAESRYVLNKSFELQGGVGFSSFFDGDPHIFGGASYHITRQLDITGEVEVGDNDSLGLGIRYFY